MSNVQPEGEDLRKAIKWISDMRRDEPDVPLRRHVEAACLKFNLSPLDAEYLARTMLGEEAS
jgi:hypothetical protein